MDSKALAQNPFVAGPDWSGEFTVGFRVHNNSTNPLWWTGSGFKDLSRVAIQAACFPTLHAAEDCIRQELLAFIAKYRPDQVSLISGWES